MIGAIYQWLAGADDDSGIPFYTSTHIRDRWFRRHVLGKTKMKLISKHGKYRTRTGYDVVIYSSGMGQPYPVHGAYFNGNEWIPTRWKDNGNHDTPNLDLLEVKERVKRTIWIVVFHGVNNINDGSVSIHYDEESADSYIRSMPKTKAVLKRKLVIEGDEGEGL